MGRSHGRMESADSTTRRSSSSLSGNATESWSTQQLAEFLALVSSFADRASAVHRAAERAAEVLEAEIGAIVADGKLVAAVGFPAGQTPDDALVGLAAEMPAVADLPGLGPCSLVAMPLEDDAQACLIVARVGEAGFTVE